MLGLYSCKAQNIYDDEIISYTLKNFEHCLFYNEQLSKSEGIDIRKLNRSPYYLNKKDYTDESKKLLLQIIKKRYSDEYIRDVSKKRILFSFKSELREISEKLKDSSNFIRLNKFYKSHYFNVKKRQKKIQKILSNPKMDTIPEYKNRLDRLYKSLKKYKLPNGLIYSVAFVEDRDKAIPFLKELLNDTIHINSYAIKIALAKLKVEPFYTSQFIKLKEEVKHIVTVQEDENNSRINIFYAYPRTGLILTKEAIFAYSKVLEAKYFDTIDHGDVSESSIPIRTLDHLFKLIDNNDFKEHFKNEGYLKSYLECTKEDIKWAIEWFKKNKNKIIVNQNHIPLLHEGL